MKGSEVIAPTFTQNTNLSRQRHNQIRILLSYSLFIRVRGEVRLVVLFILFS